MNKIYIREDVCMGCGLCRVYCQTAHSKSKDILKAFKKEDPRPLPRIRVERNGDVCFSIQCRHCEEPLCVYSCLTGASYKDPISGKVSVDPEKCIGCWTCVVACPNGALTRDTSNHVVVKCDLCPEEEMPACVANCPNEALILAEVGANVGAGGCRDRKQCRNLVGMNDIIANLGYQLLTKNDPGHNHDVIY